MDATAAAPHTSRAPWERMAHGGGLLTGAGELSGTVFEEMSRLAARTGAINLGQGFPDVDGPPEMLDAAAAALRGGGNQYSPVAGVPQLQEAVAEHQRRFYGLEPDPASGVVVTVGASEGLAASLLAFLRPGDEVVTFEPHYDLYGAVVEFAGARLVTVPLEPPRFSPDLDRLAAAFGPRTRVVILNDPHNPTGTVFDDAVLSRVVGLAAEHDCVVVTDEVYEHLRYGGAHRPLATLPGAFERTLTVSSVGKTFSATGWRVGWVSGPEHLVGAVRATKAYLTHSAATPLQLGAAAALRLPDAFYEDLAEDFRQRRDVLVQGLAAAGAEPFEPQGTFFVVADVRALCERHGVGDATALAPVLAERSGVVGVPVPALASAAHRDLYGTWMRFSFGKRRDLLEQAAQRLAG
ncbi:aminotransferase class I/II-fold pyridoxal phosphate-dependent enzyme [Kocuria sediminis]|uniref:Aminotransferase n=1 Tax=Kocuria sediminis TaxID=1038857 RepID=A0A6N8GGL7_9MICC|nr:aminotransferase class I/II-fold pyridoxal phosphate-dependent enzyme [Kocuria sediminis]MUN61849.1 aminotransferase class I/II-fold pyridoxal phosphate-dependent enzyme [Kocuria sediminis]